MMPNFGVIEKLTCACYFQIALETYHAITYTKKSTLTCNLSVDFGESKPALRSCSKLNRASLKLHEQKWVRREF